MKIAFLGDSITLGYDLADKSKRYSTLLCKSLGAEEENYGITGTLIAKAGLNLQDGKDFVSRISLIKDAPVAIIFGGTNDYFWSNAPIQGDSDKYFSHALQSLCSYISLQRKDKITLFVTPYPHNGIGNYLGAKVWNESNRHDTSAINYNGHTLLHYVTEIENACKKYSLPYLNLHDSFYFDHKIHTTDGCHPNELGHSLIAKAIENKLNTLLK